MNYLLKQATINKLAQTRLAVNYVLRNRYMNKKADREYNKNNWLYNKNGDMNLLGHTVGRLFGFPTHNQAYDNPEPSPYSGQHVNRYDSAASTREYINGMENGPLKNQFKQQYYDWHVAPGINGTHPNTKMIPPPLLPKKRDDIAPQKWTPNKLKVQKVTPKLQPGLYPPSQFPPMPEHIERQLNTPPTPSDIVPPVYTDTPLGRLRLIDDGYATPFYEQYSGDRNQPNERMPIDLDKLRGAFPNRLIEGISSPRQYKEIQEIPKWNGNLNDVLVY